MGEMVIAAYRPKEGRYGELLELVRDHVPRLRRLGLATERPVLAMRGEGDVIVEVFEWEEGGVARAHEHPEVLKLWDDFAAVCDFVPLAALAEAQRPFPGFVPIEPASKQ